MKDVEKVVEVMDEDPKKNKDGVSPVYGSDEEGDGVKKPEEKEEA